MAKSKPKAGTVRIPKDTGEGGGRVRVPEGDYRAKILSIKQDTSQAGNQMLVVTYQGLDGAMKGKKVKDYMALTTKASWKVRGWLKALGAKTPESEFDLPFKKLVGKEVGVTLQDDEYTNDKGKSTISSKISDYLSLEDLEADDDEDDDDDEDSEDEDSDDDDDEDDDDEDDDDDDEEEEELDDLNLDEL